MSTRQLLLCAVLAFARLSAADDDGAGESVGCAHLTWDRGSTAKDDVQLQKAARLHQAGELDQAVTILKAVVKGSPQHAEAYASLSKALFDQGKTGLAEKAMAKATKLNNDQLAEWSLF